MKSTEGLMSRGFHLVATLAAVVALGAAVRGFGQPADDSFASDRSPQTKQAAATILAPSPLSVGKVVPADYTLDRLLRLALENNPRLAQAEFVIEAARGRALQAGLYPNPTISANFDELGDRTAPNGVNTIPLVTQEIVTGGKLGLSRAAAMKEVDQATFALATRRAELLAAVRSAHFDLLTLKRRIELLEELKSISQKSVEHTKELVRAKQATQLDVVQLEVEAERFRAEFEAAEQELPAAFRRLAAVVGMKDLERAPIAGSLDETIPDYELDLLRKYVLTVHPDVFAAQAGLEKAKLAWQRANAEVIPNVTVSGGYVRQNQNKSNDYVVGVSLPVPVWNRNEGNIQTAQAQIGEATREISRVENDLTERIATAYREYAAARKRAERFAEVQKKAEEAYKLIVEEKNFTLSAVQRLVAQQAVAQASLEHVKARGEAWRAASVISGLTLEEQWPVRVLPVPEKK
jgi:cobalt-zinc-cadmium efflux system outer membrane protein